MKVSTLSSKNQTTLNAELVKVLKLAPGMRLKQWVEGGRIILEPMDDVSSAFGALKSKAKAGSIREETEAMEMAIAREGARRVKRQ